MSAPLLLRIPQVRDGVEFYPSAMEKGACSEKALLLALPEMYVQGASTRKVTKIVEELCGHSVSSTQISARAAKLDVELQSWRDRPLGSYSYMILDARYEKVRQGGSRPGREQRVAGECQLRGEEHFPAELP